MEPTQHIFSDYSGCLDYPDLVNGNMTLLEKNSHYELHFSCFDGFKLLGKQKLICNNEEFDNESKPQCVQGM